MATFNEMIEPQVEKSYLTEGYVRSNVPCEFITGPAGSGKTYDQKKAIEENPKYGILAATTGIAAINLGASTINSILKFFDTDSLRDRFDRGYLSSTLGKIGRRVKKLVIDEVSMMDGRQLDYIHEALKTTNEYDYMSSGPLGITLTGDFCQLPPVNAPWAFEADAWEHFERNTTMKTTNYRQDNGVFLEALTHARAGRGTQATKLFQDLNVKFRPATNPNFDGTTILSKNQQVDNYNFSSLLKLPGTPYGLNSMKWGIEASEWKNNIPEVLKLKDGALVMILANSPAQVEEEFRYANGDTGHIQQHDIDGTIWVKLTRNDVVVPIQPIIRHKSEREPKNLYYKDPMGKSIAPDITKFEHIYCGGDCGIDEPGKKTGTWGEITYNCSYDTWNIGAIRYYPLRLAYATTVHKSQGLTLDNCQIDCRDQFFGSPSMAYVALSRCRTPEGLTIVGTPEILAGRIKVDPKVKRWL